MSRNKVDALGCKEIIENGMSQSKTLREIAAECSEHAGETISHVTVKRYIDAMSNEGQAEKKEVILQDRRRVLKVVNQELDIIQIQLETTEALLSRFKLIDDLPEMFRSRMEEAINEMEQTEDASDEYIAYNRKWVAEVEKELKRKVYELTSLNRELRENSKFLAEIRAKAFSFSLVQEYLALFMQKFKEESKDGAFERTIQWISANPRMQQIVDQQRIIMDQG